NVFNDTLHHGGYYATTDLLADVNGDALPDLVIAPEYNDQYNLAVTALINQGGGRFAVQDPVQINSAQNAFGLGLLSAGSLPSILGVGQQPDDYHENLSTFLALGTNTSSVTHSYLAEVNSPGSYGGYNFGFVNGAAVLDHFIAGTAYIDLNGNGRQDPGEP